MYPYVYIYIYKYMYYEIFCIVAHLKEWLVRIVAESSVDGIYDPRRIQTLDYAPRNHRRTMSLQVIFKFGFCHLCHETRKERVGWHEKNVVKEGGTAVAQVSQWLAERSVRKCGIAGHRMVDTSHRRRRLTRLGGALTGEVLRWVQFNYLYFG